MKKCSILFLCLLLCCAPFSARMEEAEEIVLSEAYRMMVGRVSFTFPAPPDLILEEDRTMEEALDKGAPYAAWTDKKQLTGQTDDQAEFRVHILNAAPLLSWLRETHPGEAEQQYQLYALMNLIQYFSSLLEGVITDAPAMGLTGPQEAPLPVMMFAYRNTRSSIWHYGKAMMDGETAVIMMAREAPETVAVIKDMRVVTQAERDAYDARQPQTVRIRRMDITFPVPPIIQGTVGHEAQQVLCPDGTLLTADFLEMPDWMFPEGESQGFNIKRFVEKTAENYKENDVITDYEIKKEAEGIYGFRATCQLKVLVNGMVPVRDIMRCFVTPNGIYTVTANDTDTGRAFLDSIQFVSKSEEAPPLNQREETDTEEYPDDEGPSAFEVVLTDLF